jgi:glucokinase
MERIAPADFVVGIDIGGSHITAGLVNVLGKNIIENFMIRRSVDPHGSSEAILTRWCEVIRQVWYEFGIQKSRLGFAMPGPFDYASGLCLIKGFDKYEALYDINVRVALADRLSISGKDISFRNDAEAFLEGEVLCGAAAGHQRAIGITLGTGLGSAVSCDGVTKDAALSVIEYQGEKIDELISTRGILRIYRDLTGRTLENVMAVTELYHTDPNAKQTFAIFAERLSWFLEFFIKTEQPEILVVGGNIVHSWDLFMNDVTRHLSSRITYLPKIAKASLGEHAALIGAACWGKSDCPLSIFPSKSDQTII